MVFTVWAKKRLPSDADLFKHVDSWAFRVVCSRRGGEFNASSVLAEIGARNRCRTGGQEGGDRPFD